MKGTIKAHLSLPFVCPSPLPWQDWGPKGSQSCIPSRLVGGRGESAQSARWLSAAAPNTHTRLHLTRTHI